MFNFDFVNSLIAQLQQQNKAIRSQNKLANAANSVVLQLYNNEEIQEELSTSINQNITVSNTDITQLQTVEHSLQQYIEVQEQVKCVLNDINMKFQHDSLSNDEKNDVLTQMAHIQSVLHQNSTMQ